MTVNLFVPLSKVDAQRQEVWGWAAIEEPDRSREVMDYALSKPNFLAWSDAAMKATGGKSKGNLRSMHNPVAAGKLIHLEADDARKGFFVGVEVVDAGEWAKVEEGVYTGFSIGGDYGKRWRAGDLLHYEAIPNEISLVDLPCIPGAVFEMVKVDGSVEMRKVGLPTPGAEYGAIPILPVEYDLTEGESESESTAAPDGEADISKSFEGGNDMPNMKKVAADPGKALTMLQALRDEIEAGGDPEKARLLTEAIAMLTQATQADAPVEPAPDEAEAVVEDAPNPPAPFPEGEGGEEEVVEAVAKAGKMLSTNNAQAMHQAIRSLATILATAGDEVGQKVSALYYDDGAGQPNPDPSLKGREMGAEKAALAGAMSKIAEMQAEQDALKKRLMALEKAPAAGGPAAMQHGGAPVEKSMAGSPASDLKKATQPQAADAAAQSIAELRKLAALEPNPIKKAEYGRQLFIAEQATVRK